MDSTTRNALSNPESWKRGAVMLLFFLLLAVITPLLILVSLVGWVFLMVQGQVPEAIREFGRSLAAWYGQTARYLTGDARRRPFPFEDLDCPNDEPPVGDAAGDDQPRSTRSSSAASRAASQAEAPAPKPGKTAAKKTGSKKAGKKKATKKKAKKSVKKKASGKRGGGSQAASEAAGDPVTPRGDQER